MNHSKSAWFIVVAAQNVISSVSVGDYRNALPIEDMPRWQFTLKLRMPNRRLLGIRYEPAFRKSVWEFCHFLENVKEHAPPLAGASVETGMEVHVTGDVDDKAASGGCVARLVRFLLFISLLWICRYCRSRRNSTEKPGWRLRKR